MKTKSGILIVFSLIFFLRVNQDVLALDCENPIELQCHFYSACLEKKHPCLGEGYALGYGAYYCEKFIANDNFSVKGLIWRNLTLLCLQRELVPVLSDDHLSCEEITDIAFDSHPTCYTQSESSICFLPPRDVKTIIGTIHKRDLLSKRGRRQLVKVARICLAQFILSNEETEVWEGLAEEI